MSRYMPESWGPYPENQPARSVRRRLDPRSLGRLATLYEHKVFTEAAVWDVNSFDQRCVELGKQLALPLIEALTGNGAAPAEPDSSMAGLLAALKELRISTHA